MTSGSDSFSAGFDVTRTSRWFPAASWVTFVVFLTVLATRDASAAEQPSESAAANDGDTVVAVGSGSIPLLERVRVVEPARDIGDFELIGRDGTPFRFSQLRGRPALVAFGFTSCPDVCPTVMSRLLLLNRLHGAELGDTTVVLISVDGERDSPSRMDEFLSMFSADFIGLTGMPEVVRPIADRFPAVFFKESPDAAGHYNVAHSAQVFVVDRRGRVRAELLNAPIDTMAEVVRIVAMESL